MENPALLAGIPLLAIGVVGFIAFLGMILAPEQQPAVVVAPQAAHIGGHPGPAEYVMIGLALAIITGIEVGVYYIDALDDALAAILLVLSAVKFGLVVLWFMHLKFDSRIFTTAFVTGLALAIALFIVVLATLGSNLV